MNAHNATTILNQMNELEKTIFKHLMSQPGPMAQSDLSAKMEVSQSTVSRQLNKMMDRGIVEKTGQTKGARFSLSEKMRYWATPYHRRPASFFSTDRFRNYEPNVTQWLPDSIKEKMSGAAPAQQVLDASTYSKGIAERFLIDLSWASSSLEGNTYSLLETESLVKYGQIADSKSTHEATMILNHKRAIAILIDQVGEPSLHLEQVQKIHTFMMRDLLEFSTLGKIRTSGVRISSSCYVPSDNHRELSSTLGDILFKANQIVDPYEAMFFLMAGISYLQPFEDGNKRMGRLLCNLPLLQAGLPPMSFIGVDKTDYIQGLIEFYELGETSLLAQTLGDAYVGAAHVYQLSTKALRTPKSVELKLRKEITSLMKHVIEEKIILSQDIENAIGEKLPHLEEDERNSVLNVLNEYCQQLNPTNGILWDVDQHAITQYIDIRDQVPAKNKSLKF